MSEIKVSRVLHLSNITHNISRFDIIDEIQCIANVKQVFVLRPNNQALVEMNTTEDALKVYNHFSEQQLIILGNAIELKFSHYDKLVKPEEQVLSQCVLLVSIICRDNSTLSLRHFYSVCSQFGKVHRIRMFIHQAGPQALVQYSHLYDCIRAKGELEKATFLHNGRRYSFEVQYSRLKELVIHKNNNYSRDFHLYPMDMELPSTPYPAHAALPSTYSPVDFSYGGYHDSPFAEADSLSSSSQSSPRFFQPYPPKQSPFSLLSSASPYDSLAHPSSFEYTSVNPFLQDVPPARAAFRRQSSDYSLLSSASSVCNEPLPSPFAYEQDPQSVSRFMSLNMRKYVLDGFTEVMPISDLVDYLYGMNVKYAEYKKNMHHYSVIIYGVSEWSDAMLVNYLRGNPVKGRMITLRGPSEPVSSY